MKIGGVLTKSDNAIWAERNERYPMTSARKVLRERLLAKGIDVTLTQADWLLKEIRCSTEWHHVSKWANEVDYYDVDDAVQTLTSFDDDEDKEEAMALVQQARLTCKKRKDPTERTVRVQIKYTEWSGYGRHKSRNDYGYEGRATIKGNWIKFDGKRKKLSGNWITVTELKGDQK